MGASRPLPEQEFDPATQFANDLLPATLSNARRLPFYQRHWQGHDEYVATVAHLAQLPVLTKAMATELFGSFSYQEAPAVLLHTSGTSGKITVRCRSSAEITALIAVKSRAP